MIFAAALLIGWLLFVAFFAVKDMIWGDHWLRPGDHYPAFKKRPGKNLRRKL